MKIERPLDLLNSAKDKNVMVELKNKRQLVGKLKAFDIHINIVLEEAKEMEEGNVTRSLGNVFIRGDTIIFIVPS